MGYRIVVKPAVTLMGIECRTSNQSAMVDIPKHWENFYQQDIAPKVPNKISQDVYAMYCDYESDHTGLYSLVIGCKVGSVDAVLEGMVIKKVPASVYAVFTAKGDFPQSVVEQWQSIWQSDLKRSYIADFEVYGDAFHSKDSKEVDIFIGLKDYSFERQSELNPLDSLVLFNGINTHAAKVKGHNPIQSFGFFIKDQQGNVIAGVQGVTYYGCIYIDMLWVEERYRSYGLATSLMHAAEDLGKERKCTFATVSTMDWEALPFYQKLGFEIEFIRSGYEKDSKLYMLRKSLL